jgi:hypothetical protein
MLKTGQWDLDMGMDSGVDPWTCNKENMAIGLTLISSSYKYMKMLMKGKTI